MKCEKAEQIILAGRVKNELSGAQLESFEEHLKKCRPCRIFLKTASEINELLRNADNKQVPGYLYAKVLKKIEDERNPSFFKLFVNRRVFAPAISLAAALLLAIGTYFFAFSVRVHPLGAANTLDNITNIYEGNSADSQSDRSPVNFGSAAEEFL